MVKLRDIAKIRLGYSFRESVSDIARGDLPVIQFKNVANSIISNLAECSRISSDKIKEGHFLNYKDVLLSNRGCYKSSLFALNKKCIASGVFFIISVKDQSFLPEFIVVYLNSEKGQKALFSRQNSSGIQSITRNELEQIEIPEIPLLLQKKISELFFLYEKELDIIEIIKENKKQLLNQMLNKIIKE